MKIIELTYALTSGGGERLLVDLSNELCNQNDVTIVQILSNDNPANAHYLPDVDSRIKYINLNSNKGLSWKVLYSVYRTIKNVKPDVVHIHCSLLTVALSALLYKKPKYYHTLHSLAQRCVNPQQLSFIYKYLYKNHVQPITISQVCHKSYEDLFHLGNDVMITNGRSQIVQSKMAETVKAEMESFKEHADDKIFIHIARLHPVKNHELLFETFDRLIKEGEHIQLVVIGSGYETSPFAEYNNHKGIHILGEKRDVGDYLAASDYFVMSSKMEGLPISLLEAMSMGVMPVSTPAGGVCDVIRNGENGYISSSHSPEDFYKTIKDAITNVAGVTSECIIAEYKEKYSMIACANSYLEEFKK